MSIIEPNNTRETLDKRRIMGDERDGVCRRRYKLQGQVLSRCKGGQMVDGGRAEDD